MRLAMNPPVQDSARARVFLCAVSAVTIAPVDELDPDLSTPEGRARDRLLGPFFGFVGPPARDDDPRHRPLYVTLLERLAGCPWQVFLERLLRIEPTPDPLQALPGVDPLLLGNLVHRVLERLVAEAAPEAAADLQAALAGEPRPVGWPAGGIEELLAAEAALLVEREGIPLPGLARALAARARPFLEEARLAHWPAAGSPVAVLGTEVEGALEVADAAGEPRELRFKADRVDAAATGTLLTDYKTGRPISEAKTERTRREHLLRGVAAGTRLQAAAYALAGGSGSSGSSGGVGDIGARGRYLFQKPELAAREFEVTAADREIADAFFAAAKAALAAWEAGVFFPRVVEPDGRREPMRCGWCQVAEACLRGDSGARRRLAGWAERRDGDEDGDAKQPPPPAGTASAPTDEVLLGVWRLAARTTSERRGGRR
jgi:RecB family exonuclease